MTSTDLYPWRCGNPRCPSREGQGQIVMKGENRPGWRGEGFCHQCRCYTYVEVTTDGWPVYALRPTARAIY